MRHELPRTAELKLIGHPARYALRPANADLREVYSKAHSAALRSVGKARGLLA